MSQDHLSFTLRQVLTDDDLALACKVRSEGYGHQLGTIREQMSIPDHIDRSPWTSVFLCEDKATQDPIGTMRVQTNTRGGVQLEIEKFVAPPESIAESGRGEMSRLVALPGSDPLVKYALWKAGYLFCLAMQVRWLMIGARKPALIRQYQQLGAKDIFEDQRYVPLGHGGDLPHRILALDVVAAERNWYADNHRMLRFMVDTFHPDIEVFSMHRDAAPLRRVAVG